jgi:hypothetical protein
MDRMCCEIYIGGQVTKALLPELIKVINEEGVEDEYGNGELKLENQEQLLKYVENGVLRFVHAEKANGEFGELEGWLQENGIPFNRTTEQYHDYDAEDVTWLPGMDSPLVLYKDAMGNENIPGEVVREALQALITYSTIGSSDRDQYLNRAIDLLKSVCPQLLQIPKFEVVD